MGMLDEAIRDHFDLKRRNGADPAVIAIEEREALGDPAQREADAAAIAAEREGDTHMETVVISAEADGLAVAEVQDGEPAADAAIEGETVVIAEEEVAVVAEPGDPAAEVVEEIAPEPPEQETRAFTVEESQEAVMPEPPASSPPVGTPPAAPVGTPPQEPATEGEAPEEARDELEETPEFLEETPEHDRLWFERKPPRDFDF